MTSKTEQFNANVVLENSAPSACLNYVWIGLKFSPSSDESAPPIPPETVENMINTAHSNPSVHVRIWIDSKRLSGLQVEHLREAVKNKAAQNIEICDLRSIEAYDYHNGNLFNLECCNKIEMSQFVQSRNVTVDGDGSKAFSPKTPQHRRAEKPCVIVI